MKWVPDARIGEELLRQLNNKADDAATKALSTSSEARTEWHKKQERASGFAKLALEMAVAIGKRYYDYLQGRYSDKEAI